ncbi:MAG: helix-turn-helix domain-containing protein [Clostridiaceae bacterium]
MVKYTRLWETMQRKGISQYRLIKTYGISNGQLNRLRKNLYISTHTVETLCRILDCRVEDVMEIVFDESDELYGLGTGERRRQKLGGAGGRKRRGRDSKDPVWQNLVHNRLRKCSCLRYREQNPAVKKEK